MEFAHLNGMMFDLETLGKEPGCAILSIGACRFDLEKKTIFDDFYVTIDAQDSLKQGLTYNRETLQWWREQNPAALKGIQKNSLPAAEALNMFFEYLSKKKNEPLWAWGPHFDVSITQAAMTKVLGITKMPWQYYNVFDARTVSNVFGVDINREEGVHHNALDDAKAQAKYLIELFNGF
jgi:hypothetical protein